MKITFSLSTSKITDYYASESELKTNLKLYVNHLGPAEIRHFALFELSNDDNEKVSFYDGMQHIMFQLCFAPQTALLNNQVFTYRHSDVFKEFHLKPYLSTVDFFYEKDKFVTFSKSDLCVALYKCGQRYIDFLLELPQLGHDLEAEIFQSFADKTKQLLQNHDLL